MPSFFRPLGDNAGQPLTLRKRTTSLGRARTTAPRLYRSVCGYHAEVELLDGGGAVLHDRGADGSGSRFGSFVGDDHFTGGWRECATATSYDWAPCSTASRSAMKRARARPCHRLLGQNNLLQNQASNAAKRALRERNEPFQKKSCQGRGAGCRS